MKIAVFSDIHSNFQAFSSCVQQAEKEGVQQMLFLGDYVSDCACPLEVLDLLYRLQKENPCSIVKGNREEYMEARRSGMSDWAKGWTYGSQSGSLLYTYEKLRQKDFQFFSELPITDRVEIAGHKPIRICHGTPGTSRDALMPGSPEADFWADGIEEPYVLCGHSHQYVDFVCHGKRIVNFASTGSPVEGNPMASMGILESDGKSWEFHRVLVPYYAEDSIREFIPSGLSEKAFWWPAAIARQLRTGENSPLLLFQRVLTLGEETGTPDKLPEALWDQAAAELGIAPLEEEAS